VSRYEYVDSQKTEPTNRNPVVKMCRWLDVSTSRRDSLKVLAKWGACLIS